MKQVSSFLRSSALAAVLTSFVILSMASAHAQTGTAAQGSGAAQGGSAQAKSAADQPASGWSENAPDRGSWLSRIFGRSDPGPATSGQADSSGWSSSKQESGGCRDSITGKEDFLCKLGRILWGPDRPQGPNRDMDDNVTAGGAGG
jgi:hypothetical protein